MLVTYYSTEYRNEYSGETEFTVIPSVRVSYKLDNGLLHCSGKIGIYDKGTPLDIYGSCVTDVYYVEDCFIPVNNKGSIIKLLEYSSKELTDTDIEKIYEKVAPDIFSFLTKENAKDELLDALSKKKEKNKIVNQIITKLATLKNQEIMVKVLSRYDVSIDRIEVLIKKGINLKNIYKDPYKIFNHYDINLDIAEKILQDSDNYRPYDLRRIIGYTTNALNYLKQAGNTCCTFRQLTDCANARIKYISTDKQYLSISLVNLAISEMKNIAGIHMINEEPYIYLNDVWEEENTIIHHLNRLSSNKRNFDALVSIDKIEKKFGIKYNKDQRKVFDSLKTSGVKIITGPPGSGKTSVIKGLIEHFGKNGKIKLAATTGMAANVMSGQGEYLTETVNLMLNVIPFNDSIKSRDINNPVDADLIIVDEVSMLGMQLCSALVKAVKSGSVLLLVGDENQLQSVDYGDILHDLINTGKFDVYRLTEIIRQSGTICENADKVNRGCCELKEDGSFIIREYDDNDKCLEDIRRNVISEIDRFENSDKEIQIVCPIKKGNLSVTAINDLFIHCKNEPVVVYGKKTFYLNDKVIMTKNNYEKNYINGDIGRIIGSEEDCFIVRFGEKVLKLDREDLQYMEYAYCVTVHKSQGSEFGDVHIVLPSDAEHMMTKRLLYTSITRARKRVFIYSIKGNQALEKAINNFREHPRETLLKDRIVI